MDWNKLEYMYLILDIAPLVNLLCIRDCTCTHAQSSQRN